MGLLDEIKDAGMKKGPTCGVAALLSGMTAEDSADLRVALADQTVYATTLSRVLTARGHRIAEGAINRHRNRLCACETR